MHRFGVNKNMEMVLDNFSWLRRHVSSCPSKYIPIGLEERTELLLTLLPSIAPIFMNRVN